MTNLIKELDEVVFTDLQRFDGLESPAKNRVVVFSPDSRFTVEEFRARRAAELRAAAERRRRPHVYDGLDLRAEARRYCRVLGIRVPEVKVRHSASGGSSGRAWPRSRRVVLTLGPRVERARVMELLLHELAHVATPGEHHGERFRSLLVRSARELWGVSVEGWTQAEAVQGKLAYGLDKLVLDELRGRLEAGLTSYEVADSEAKHSPEGRLEEKRRKRLEHARYMVLTHERNAARHEKLAKKWRTKVKRLERSLK